MYTCIRIATAEISIFGEFVVINRRIGFTFSNNSDVVPPSEAHPNSIFVFNDVACDKEDTVREYFSMGRHSHVDCFYLCQSYARIPKHLI